MASKAKMAWTAICFPKNEGGLGLKRLEAWNQTSMFRHILNIFARFGSLSLGGLD